MNTSRDVISHGCSIAENLISRGENSIAQNLYDRMNGEVDGFDEIQYAELSPYVEVLGKHYASKRSEADVSNLETHGWTSKTGWTKNRPDADKQADLVNVSMVARSTAATVIVASRLL